MKQIVPFKKELSFKTKVSEITSISLEREINVEEEGIITGVFHITGNYKMNEGSINRDEFSFDLPFDITLAKKIVKGEIEGAKIVTGLYYPVRILCFDLKSVFPIVAAVMRENGTEEVQIFTNEGAFFKDLCSSFSFVDKDLFLLIPMIFYVMKDMVYLVLIKKYILKCF